MRALIRGWDGQRRVLSGLMIRELNTRFGRENIGFLWIMAEPLLFAMLVSLVWRLTRGASEHGISIVAFIVTGYLPLTLFRNSVNRSVSLFAANGSLMYHRQIKILDFILVRFLIEMIGTMMAYVFSGAILIYFHVFPAPADVGIFLVGFFLYCLFTLSLCFVIAPLSEMSEVLEKFMPVTTYIMIPFSGTFTLSGWLPPAVREGLKWSPFVDGMELMRFGIFGDLIRPYYSIAVPLTASMICMLLGLALCRRVRRTLVIE